MVSIILVLYRSTWIAAAVRDSLASTARFNRLSSDGRGVAIIKIWQENNPPESEISIRFILRLCE